MSTDEYTPTTDEVKAAYRQEFTTSDDVIEVPENDAEFDRFLAAHDAEVARAAKAEALEEAAEHMEASADIADDGYVANWFRAKANELRKVATDD